MTVREADLRRGIEELGLAGLPVCVHSSMRSFGHVEGGADAVIDAFLATGCTLVVPTFRYANEIEPPEDAPVYERNGWSEARRARLVSATPEHYAPNSNTLTESEMGAIPAAVLRRPERARGLHPIDSFSAVGPLAGEIIATQTPMNVYGPLRAIGARGGHVVLMGVGLNRMTLLHAAEQDSGRELFHRWALDREGQPVEALIGGCSEGFHRLEPAIGHLARETQVGQSRWRAFPVNATLAAAADAIRTNPQITHCGDPECGTCPDAVLGGPIARG